MDDILAQLTEDEHTAMRAALRSPVRALVYVTCALAVIRQEGLAYATYANDTPAILDHYAHMCLMWQTCADYAL